MNRYHALFKDLIRQTEAGQLKWHQLKRSANGDLIYDLDFVSRQFSASWYRDGGQQTLLLVECKRLVQEHPLFPAQEERYTKLFVLEGGQLVDLIGTEWNWVEQLWLIKTVVHFSESLEALEETG